MLNIGAKSRNANTGTGQVSHQYIHTVFLVTGSILLTLTLMETTLRLFPGLLPVELQELIRADPNNYGVSHPYIGYLHRPHGALVVSGRDFSVVHHTDSHGFRNAGAWPERAEIVAVGDSLTFGYGVEDGQSWPALLAKKLPHNPLINLGLMGGGPQQYLRVYETFGKKLHPKLALVGFFVRNDFWDGDMFDRWLKSGAGGNYLVWRDFGRPKRVGFSPQQPVASLIHTIQWRSHLIARKSHLFNLLLYIRGGIKKWFPSEVKMLQTADGSRLELLPGDFKSGTAGAQPDRREFQLVLNSLKSIHSTATANGAHVLIIFQPSKEETYLSLLGEEVPNAVGPLQEELKKLGIAYLDLGPAFREWAAKGEKLFFEVDGHPNARGYALIAELVLSHLKVNARKYGLKDWERDSSEPRS